jgi:hypothetical protein
MADRLMGGQLVETVHAYRRSGIAWAAIARLLHDQHGVEVSPETLRVWIEKDVAAEAAS